MAYDTRYRQFFRISNWSSCRSLFGSGPVTLAKLIIFIKKIYTAIVQVYLQSFSERMLCFRAFDTRYLHFQSFFQWFNGFMAYDTRYRQFFRISNCSNCRSLFWSGHVTLVNLIIFVKQNYTAIVQMYLQSFYVWLLRFKAYDTRCLHFYQMANWVNCRSLSWNDHVDLVKLLVFSKDIFTAIIKVVLIGS